MSQEISNTLQSHVESLSDSNKLFPFRKAQATEMLIACSYISQESTYLCSLNHSIFVYTCLFSFFKKRILGLARAILRLIFCGSLTK